MCTRVIYTPKEKQSYVGRNMDWAVNPSPQLWVMPPNVKRKAMAKTERGQEFKWKSKYSSVIVSNFGISNSDGLNSEGLAVNLLWLSSSKYPDGPHHKNAFPMSMSIWAQYILDSCKNVKEAVYAMKDIYIQTTTIPDDPSKLATCHLSVGDKKGNSLVFEYISGRLHIYTNVDTSGEKFSDFPHIIKHYTQDEMRVMTNDPKFDTQIGSLVYWDELHETYKDGPALLPGSNLSLSRFVRATYFSRQLPKNAPQNLALARLSGVINNAAQPATSVENADVSRTQYNSFADQSRLHYFFRSAYGPFLIWIDLSDVNFDKLKNKKGYAFTLQLNEDGVFQDCDKQAISGKVNQYLTVEKMFPFLPIP
ncbi:linear amide C-N hydrolase, choloylglycine hydrolase family [Kordia sp. SMS9]|uniref:linear amide C-N hydrolase n=1 Tax=Kordia sp. SMS9 TaxID=2282170 RepID=UPI000E0DE8C7|nr:linear amide C-N hydrolase [Kordia sp. SMS9]AXG70307.1 linear amide C-N hydrolase, choloylglycine hydrolase family [Kordia sp. SMS9]